MRVVTRNIYHTSKSDEFTFVNMFDVHSGETNHDDKLFKRAVSRIAAQDDKTFVIGGGDYGGFINHKDPRFVAECVRLEVGRKRGAARADGTAAELSVQEQLQELHHYQAIDFADKVESISDRFLVLNKGNHELSALKHSGVDVVNKIAEKMYKGRWGGEWPELVGGYMTLMRLCFVREAKSSISSREIIIGIHHGHGGGRKKGAKINRAVDMFDSFPECDIVVMGHVHDPMATICGTVRKHDKRDSSYRRNRVAMVAPSFADTYVDDYTGYGEIAGYPQSAMGVSVFKIAPWDCDEAPNITTLMSTNGLPLPRRTVDID